MSVVPDPITRLAAADPAQGLAVDEGSRALVWQRVLAVQATSQPALAGMSPLASPPPGVVPGRPGRRRVGSWPRGHRRPHVRRRTLMLIVPALLALAGCGALAAGVIRFGAPAKSSPHVFPGPRAGTGTPIPGAERLLAIATPDPEGGPGWGIRLYHTTRGLGCVQVGRVFDGKFGALGQDGAFGDDGRFHEVPVNAPLIESDCSNLDANGRTFMNKSVFNQAASGWSGRGSCSPASSNKLNIPPDSGICEQSHERDLYYGLLGPDAQSITYVSDGHSVTQATSGLEGAYLLVVHATPNKIFNFMDAGDGGVVPISGPITAVHYRDGRTCNLTARSWIGGVDACTPSLPEPVGYVSPGGSPLTHAQVATPLHVRLVRARTGDGYEMLLSFKSRVAITNARRLYQFEWREPDMRGKVYAFSITQGDIAVGQTVAKNVGRGLGRGLMPGVTRGTVSFMQSTGGEEKEKAGVLVGRFAVRVP